MSLIEISHGQFSAGIDPAVGGGLAYWRGSRDFVRPAAPGEDDPLQFGCFPLVPYSNRIRDGRFEFDGQVIQLPLNFGDHPHSIHGHGWQNAWDLVSRKDAEATLQYRHGGGAWPFPYLAEQIFRLDQDGLSIEMRLTNLGAGPMPCGLGWHPYFPATSETFIEAQIDGVWLTDDEVMPTVWSRPPPAWDLRQGPPVGDMGCDNLFTGWDGAARITWPEWGLGLTIRASGNLGYLVIYAPRGEDFFCVEPVSHCTDAFNSGEDRGGVVLPPGGEFTASVHFQPHMP